MPDISTAQVRAAILGFLQSQYKKGRSGFEKAGEGGRSRR